MFASAGRDDVVERLLEAGILLHARGVDEGTALHYAMWGGRAPSSCCRHQRRAEPHGRRLSTPSGARLDGVGARASWIPRASGLRTTWRRRASTRRRRIVGGGDGRDRATTSRCSSKGREPRDERLYETGPVLCAWAPRWPADRRPRLGGRRVSGGHRAGSRRRWRGRGLE